MGPAEREVQLERCICLVFAVFLRDLAVPTLRGHSLCLGGASISLIEQ